MNKGLVHLYWGEGKGKTTAAFGLALRMLGSGGSVTVVQFLKDGQSSELEPLRRLGAKIYSGQPGTGFFSQMTPEERQRVRARHDELLRQAVSEACDLLILDEACAACRLKMVDEQLLWHSVLDRPVGQEIVLTGRDPADWMQEAADYSTEMCCHKHPYQQGIIARRGVEY